MTPRELLLQRAAFDLECPQPSLTVTELGFGLNAPHGVSGCGKKATYVRDPATGQWILNSPTTVRERPEESPEAARSPAQL